MKHTYIRHYIIISNLTLNDTIFDEVVVGIYNQNTQGLPGIIKMDGKERKLSERKKRR